MPNSDRAVSGAEVDGRHAEATSSVRHRLPIQEHPLCELRKAERCHREIDAAEPQRWKCHAGAEQHGDQTAARKRQPEREAKTNLQQTGGVGADPEHGGVGERQMPGVADQQIQPERENDVDQNQIANEKPIGIGDGRQHGKAQEQNDQKAAATEQSPHVTLS